MWQNKKVGNLGKLICIKKINIVKSATKSWNINTTHTTIKDC